MTNTAVRQVVSLGSQWPTIDPFLFCAHHLDDYPAGDGALGPAASLDGRPIGNDFGGVDGWNMYHGSTVPGFPQHPHRGFETVTYLRRGWCDHSDSLGARARFGQGDVQWLTAGRGIVHSEMFPLVADDAPNPLHLFQIWLNLPAAKKMVDPYFSMLWHDTIPSVAVEPGVVVTAIAGRVAAVAAPDAPPDSWAAEPENAVEIFHVELDAGTEWTLPAAPAGSQRVLYLFEGSGLRVEGQDLEASTGAVLDPSRPLDLESPTPTECLVLGGRPIGEPVAQYGPFVMTTQAEIEQAFRDYRSTEFGGWPWPTDDPVHGPDIQRFAEHPDGRTERR